MPAGRPSLYSQEMVDSICERLSIGESLRKICSDEDMPAISSVIKWLRENEDFSLQYARAKEESADSYADRIADIGEAVLRSEYEPQAARVAVDSLKWAASKLKPKQYGDRVEQVHSGSMDINRLSDEELDARIKALME